MEANHKKFLEHLDDSRSAVHKMADYFNERGYSVRLPPHSKAPSRDDWKDHADSGDLLVELRIEVKQLGYYFSSREDWPFRDYTNQFIVCAAHAWDNANVKPRCFYILSKCGENFAVVRSSTFKHWYVAETRDSRYENYKTKSYYCPLEHVEFRSFNNGTNTTATR